MTDPADPGDGGPAVRGGSPPPAGAWDALSADGWSAVLVLVRRELAAREVVSESERQVLERPTSRLVGGKGRRAVVDLLARDEELASRVVAGLGQADRRALAPVPTAEPRPTPQQDDDVEARRRERVRRLTEERDDWRRRAEGAQVRLEGAERERLRLQQALAARDATVEELREALSRADDERVRAVARERRRRDAELARLQAEAAALRRSDEERRAAARRDEEQARLAGAGPERPDPPPRQARLTPGRPTRLPSGVGPNTTEAARLLLGPGRLVLIDGYNVTRTHRDDLDLEGQRAWLVQRCVNAAAARRIRPVVVFDGQRAAMSRPTAARQQVEVRFTPAGITADDELALAVEATDEPVVVVTDDRELQERVRASGADVVGTMAFLGVVGR